MCGAAVASAKNVVPDAVINTKRKQDISESIIAVIAINGTKQRLKKFQRLLLRSNKSKAHAIELRLWFIFKPCKNTA